MSAQAQGPRRYVWHGGYVRWDTGMRDHQGRFILDSLTEDGAGYLAERVCPVEGEQLDACRTIWGDERPNPDAQARAADRGEVKP